MLIAGGSAGVTNWIVAITPDTLKSRLQTSPPGKYSGIAHVFTDMVRSLLNQCLCIIYGFSQDANRRPSRTVQGIDSSDD